MNDNENKTNAPIKLPVREIFTHDGFHQRWVDADGRAVLMSDIVAALNEAEALRAEVEDLLSQAMTIRLDGGADILRGTYPDSGNKYWMETWNGTLHNTALLAYAAIKPNAAAGEEKQDGK